MIILQLELFIVLGSLLLGLLTYWKEIPAIKPTLAMVARLIIIFNVFAVIMFVIGYLIGG